MASFSRDHRTELPQVAATGLHGGWLPYDPTARLLLRYRGPQHFRTGSVDYLPVRLTAAMDALSAPFLMSLSTNADAMSPP